MKAGKHVLCEMQIHINRLDPCVGKTARCITKSTFFSTRHEPKKKKKKEKKKKHQKPKNKKHPIDLKMRSNSKLLVTQHGRR